MSYLRIFDINYNGLGENDDLINQFNSSFWTEHQWIFTHQHTCKATLDCGIFYSIKPYR